MICNKSGNRIEAAHTDGILTPEMDYDLDALPQHCLNIRKRDHNHALVIFAEAVKRDAGAAGQWSQRPRDLAPISESRQRLRAWQRRFDI